MPSEMSRWEPGRELASLRDELERMWRQTFGTTGEPATLSGSWTPALDVEETEDAFVINVEAPGVKPEDLDVSLDDDVLKVTGERHFYEDKRDDQFRRIERRFGSFRRSVRLPSPVDARSVQATFADGVLTVTAPKAEESKPHRIEVKPPA